MSVERAMEGNDSGHCAQIVALGQVLVDESVVAFHCVMITSYDTQLGYAIQS